MCYHKCDSGVCRTKEIIKYRYDILVIQKIKNYKYY